MRSTLRIIKVSSLQGVRSEVHKEKEAQNFQSAFGDSIYPPPQTWDIIFLKYFTKINTDGRVSFFFKIVAVLIFYETLLTCS